MNRIYVFIICIILCGCAKAQLNKDFRYRFLRLSVRVFSPEFPRQMGYSYEDYFICLFPDSAVIHGFLTENFNSSHIYFNRVVRNQQLALLNEILYNIKSNENIISDKFTMHGDYLLFIEEFSPQDTLYEVKRYDQNAYPSIFIKLFGNEEYEKNCKKMVEQQTPIILVRDKIKFDRFYSPTITSIFKIKNETYWDITIISSDSIGNSLILNYYVNNTTNDIQDTLFTIREKEQFQTIRDFYNKLKRNKHCQKRKNNHHQYYVEMETYYPQYKKYCYKMQKENVTFLKIFDRVGHVP